MIWQCPGLCPEKTLIRSFPREFKRAVLIILFLLCTSGEVMLAQETPEIFSVKAVRGDWQHELKQGREVISTDQAGAVASLEINVPKDGDYQIVVRLGHEWREFCPFLYMRVVDSRGEKFSGYTFSETRWYLEPGEERWEYRAPSAFPFWHLAAGTAKVDFWLESKKSCWDAENTLMENRVFIEQLFLVPVRGEIRKQKNMFDQE